MMMDVGRLGQCDSNVFSGGLYGDCNLDISFLDICIELVLIFFVMMCIWDDGVVRMQLWIQFGLGEGGNCLFLVLEFCKSFISVY